MSPVCKEYTYGGITEGKTRTTLSPESVTTPYESNIKY